MDPLHLLVVNQFDQTVGLLDRVSGAVVGTVAVPEVTGHEVAVTPDRCTAFVPIYGNSGVGLPGTDGSAVAVIDVPARTVRGVIRFARGVRPHHPVYDPCRSLLYVTTELDESVSVIEPETLAVLGAIPTAQAEAHMLAVSRDGRRGYTANVGPGTISVLDLEERRNLAVIPVAGRVQRISLSNDDALVFTCDQSRPRLAVASTVRYEDIRWIPLPGIGYGSVPTTDGRFLLIALWQTDRLAVVDLERLVVVHAITVDPGPVQILLHPDGETAWVSSTSAGTVCEVDLGGEPAGWTMRRSLRAGAGADGMAWV